MIISQSFEASNLNLKLSSSISGIFPNLFYRMMKRYHFVTLLLGKWSEKRQSIGQPDQEGGLPLWPSQIHFRKMLAHSFVYTCLWNRNHKSLTEPLWLGKLTSSFAEIEILMRSSLNWHALENNIAHMCLHSVNATKSSH